MWYALNCTTCHLPILLDVVITFSSLNLNTFFVIFRIFCDEIFPYNETKNVLYDCTIITN